MRDIVINPNIDGSAFKSFIHLLTQKTNDVLDIVIQFFMFMALATSFLGASLRSDRLPQRRPPSLHTQRKSSNLPSTYLPTAIGDRTCVQSIHRHS